MARLTPLSTVRSQVKAECAKSLQSTSTAQDGEINQVIFDSQMWLAKQYDWPFLKDRWDVGIGPSSRYVAFPTQTTAGLNALINFERAGQLALFIKWNNIWLDVVYGIREIEEFNYLDSDRGQVLDPVQRWQFFDQSRFEIWPMNASGQTIRFIGQRMVTELRSSNLGVLPIVWNDAALCDIDDEIIMYFAAGRYMTAQNKPALAKTFFELGDKAMAQVRSTYPVITKPPTIMGGSSEFGRQERRLVPLVLVGGR